MYPRSYFTIKICIYIVVNRSIYTSTYKTYAPSSNNTYYSCNTRSILSSLSTSTPLIFMKRFATFLTYFGLHNCIWGMDWHYVSFFFSLIVAVIEIDLCKAVRQKESLYIYLHWVLPFAHKFAFTWQTGFQEKGNLHSTFLFWMHKRTNFRSLARLFSSFMPLCQ